MKISEIFFGCQGEGETLGTPSIFVRVVGCNKHCSFCDSKYALSGGEEMTTEQIVKKIQSFRCKNIIFTGGEPTLFQKELIQIMEKLLDYNLFYHFEIETNGTISPEKRLAELTDLFTVSPKFEDFTYCPAYSNIEDLAERPQVVYKFVIDKSEDFKDIENFFKKYLYKGETVYLMPCAVTSEDINKRLPMLIEYAKNNLYRRFKVTTRLHIQAFGNTRGT